MPKQTEFICICGNQLPVHAGTRVANILSWMNNPSISSGAEGSGARLVLQRSLVQYFSQSRDMLGSFLLFSHMVTLIKPTSEKPAILIHND